MENNKKECCDIQEAIQIFQDGISKYVQLKLPNATDAEDLTQDIILKIVKAHIDNRSVKNLKNWLYTITNNSIADYYRAKYKTDERAQELMPELETQEAMEQDIPLNDYIVPMIQLLDKKYGHILFLSDIEQMPQKKIAEQEGLSLSAVKSRVLRARKMLKALFYECCNIQFDKNNNIVSCEVKASCKPLKNAEKELNKKASKK